MKKIVYETGKFQQYPDQVAGHIVCLQAAGFHVTLSRDEPEKPEIERCEVSGSEDEGPLYCLKWGTYSMRLSETVDDPDFAGFEFEDGEIKDRLWRHSAEAVRQATKDLNGFENPSLGTFPFDEHAKYVLFRKTKGDKR